MSTFTRGLNKSQQKAVAHDHGPLLVLAGAGSGKTRVLTNRIARLVQEKVCKPSQILAVTFTNKAALEMQERISGLVSAQAGKVMTISTFHSLGARILREDGAAIGFQKNFTILDDHQRQATLKEVLRSTAGAKEKDLHDEIGTIISMAKNGSLDPEEYAKLNPDNRKLSKIYLAYHSQLRKRQTVDFDDLLLLPLRLFERHPEILQKYRERYRFISIDEFQDTNAVQLKLARLLAAPENNIMAVGDDDQGIYSWRGADIDNIISFSSFFPQCTTVILDTNYRSTRAILEGALAVVSKNHKRTAKQITAANGEGELITLSKSDDETEEALWIGQTIRDHVAQSRFTFSDHALLVRTNAMMRRFEEGLRQAKIPYRVYGAISFFERKEIKDILAYLRFFANTHDEISLQRVLKVPDRGIGSTSMEKLEELAGLRRIGLWEAIERHADADLDEAQHAKLAAFIAFFKSHATAFESGELSATLVKILREINYLELLKRASKDDDSAELRKENVDEIIRGLEIYEKKMHGRRPSLAGYLQELSLVMNDQSEDEETSKQGVRLMTLHKSKGLEFPVVFLCNLDDTIIPSPRTIAEGGIEEERRLFYVGMTRACKRLFLTYPATKEFRKKTLNVTPCRFINEIPPQFLDKTFESQHESQKQEFTANFFEEMRKKFSSGESPLPNA
jgi:DNA helicase-2/ATP-dependent DNA helicase PcrA